MSERLNKYLALQLGVSRREADDMIARSSVYINDKPAILGARVEETDTVTVNGKALGERTPILTIALHKPIGYVSSRKQQGDTPTIYSLLPEKYHSLKSIGRLDKDSSGLLLLSNDGDLAFQMTHPQFYKVKKYNVSLDLPLEPLHQQMINDFGVQLEDGPSKLTLERVDDSRKNWIITMHEGRNRQIRRTFNSLGYGVTQLHRTDFGNYTIGDLKAGEIQVVT